MAPDSGVQKIGAGADDLFILAWTCDGNESDITVEIDVAQALSVLVGQGGHSAEEAGVDVLCRQRMEKVLELHRVVSPRRPYEQATLVRQIDDALFVDHVLARAHHSLAGA